MNQTREQSARLRTDPTREQVWDEFWGDKASTDEIYPAVSDIISEIGKALPDVRGLRFLEVGAGTGREGHHFAKNGAQVWLMDISSEALRLSRTISDLPVLVRGSAVQSPFRNDTFDLVYHQGLMEHFRDPLPLLKDNHRILRPGGHLLVDVPQRYHVYTCMKHALMAANKWFAGWETEYSPRQLEVTLRAAGFRVLHRYGYFMHPGLGYRVLREIGKKTGLKLPLYPRFGPLQFLYDGWHGFTRILEKKRWGHNFAISIGVVAAK